MTYHVSKILRLFTSTITVAAALLPALQAEERWGDNLNKHDRKTVWPILRASMLKFQQDGDRGAFLKSCQDILKKYPGTGYAGQLVGIIKPLERELDEPRPPFLDMAADKRTAEETIRYWIYQLRTVNGQQLSDPGYPMLFAFAGKSPMASDQLVAIGQPAIPYLLEALYDSTPTQTIAWQRSFYPTYFLLCRQDIAMKCLERISACSFYEEGSTFTHLYMDSPERRRSAIANAREWWKRSQGKSQAQGIRNQLELRVTNVTLRSHNEVETLRLLASLEGPEQVLDRFHELAENDRFGLNSPITEALMELDRPYIVQKVIDRFWAGASRDGDYYLLLKYGDRQTYREITKRFEQTGKLDPGSWNLADQGSSAAKHGQDWAIPILGHMLTFTQTTGGRSVGQQGATQAFSSADIAAELFQKLTGHDSGYRVEFSAEDRSVAIKRAREWWLDQGRDLLKKKIDAEHEVAELGDLLMNERDVAYLVADLAGQNVPARRKAVEALQLVYSPQTQRALLTALDNEDDAVERIRILRLLQRRPATWHLPSISKLFLSIGDVKLRLAAGEVLAEQLKQQKGNGERHIRLETRETALAAIRNLAESKDEPVAVRDAAAKIVAEW